ncbi:hypothetical protein O181_027876 [Austropuccinia psidii MF-1]|uniref:Uncharacterized protein n=1 Tax=Austropuccinia psidii MF-1 TaxID=1389203 RepID=A0A9Q3CN42_9BASI|nr:hypothetical protein [Austropuccinia psidii MF-1]
MATKTPYTEQRKNTLPRRVDISTQIPTPFHKETPSNTTTIVKSEPRTIACGKESLTTISSSYQTYIPAQIAPRPPLNYAYCKEEGLSATRCTHLAEYLDRRIVRTQGASYLLPNYQRVPMEEDKSPKKTVTAFNKEKADLNKKFMEKATVKPKPEEEVKANEQK